MDRFAHNFLIKGPQVFHGPAAASDNNHICVAKTVKGFDPSRNLFSLHKGPVDDNMNPRVSPPDD